MRHQTSDAASLRVRVTFKGDRKYSFHLMTSAIRQLAPPMAEWS